MNRWVESTLQWWAPATCRLCGATAGGTVVCAACARTVGINGGRSCARCGAWMTAFGDVCRRCAGSPPPVDGVVAGLEFDQAARALIHDLKYRGRLPVAGWVARRLIEQVRGRGHDVTLLVPVPLHRARLVWRGFNQAREIARCVGRELGLPVAAPGLCHRVRATASQSRLRGARARHLNLAGSFVLRGSLQGERVAIVDDVMTTGATAFELARALRGQGAERVLVWVGCRA